MTGLSHFTTRSDEENLFRIGGNVEYQADVETAALDGLSSVQTQ
jgi:hypothetical protein